MADSNYHKDLELDFEALKESCDDPECVFCQDDDGDAAFWDEFMAEQSQIPSDEVVKVMLVDERTGSHWSLDQLNLKPYTLLEGN